MLKFLRGKIIKISIIIGYPGSGKSTIAKNILDEESFNTIIINADKLREMLEGTPINFYNFSKTEHIVRKTMFAIAKEAMLKSYNIIIDNVNLTKSIRASWINYLKMISLTECIPIQINAIWIKENNIETLVERRMKDNRGFDKEYWKIAIENLKLSFDAPLLDEGFNQIKEI